MSIATEVVDLEAQAADGSANPPKDSMVEYQRDKKRKLAGFLSDPDEPVVLDKNKESKTMSVATMSTHAPDDSSNIELAMSDGGSSNATSATLPWGGAMIFPAPQVPAEWLSDVSDGKTCGEHNGERLTAETLKALEGQLKTVVGTKAVVHEKESVDGSNLKEKDRKRLEALRIACETGDLVTSTNIGKQFLMEMAKKGTPEGDLYAGMPKADQIAMKLKWSQLKFQKFKEEKRMVKSWRRIDLEKGTYKTIDQLVMSQGSSEDAMAGICTLVRKAIQMGQPWSKINPQTDRLMFLELDFSFTEEFEVAWTHYRTEFQTGGEDAALVQGGKQALQTSVGSEQVVPKAPKGKPLAEPKGKAKAKPKPSPNVNISKFNVFWTQAVKMKMATTKAIAVGMDLVESINADETWKWARNPENKGVLEEALVDVKKELTSFHRAFLLEDAAALKKKYGEEHLTTELTSFMALKPRIDALTAMVEKVKKRNNI
jgi:hypothetical protein